jgi:hypothetical protein
MLNFDPEEDLKPLVSPAVEGQRMEGVTTANHVRNCQKTTIDWKSSEKNLCEKHPRSFLEGDEDFEGDPGSFFWWFGDEVDHFQASSRLHSCSFRLCNPDKQTSYSWDLCSLTASFLTALTTSSALVSNGRWHQSHLTLTDSLFPPPSRRVPIRRRGRRFGR